MFQLPEEAVAQLRHCIGWRKAWLLSLHICSVQVNDQVALPVKEVKVTQLRLQEDPGEKDCLIGKLLLYIHTDTTNLKVRMSSKMILLW